jgi:serine/threonine protein kinase
MLLAPGTQLGHYKIQSLIGKGGMGEVYRAVDTKLEREVAVKVLPATLAGRNWLIPGSPPKVFCLPFHLAHLGYNWRN